MKTINCKGKIIDLSEPKVMGILNITPDSFYDGGKYKSEKEILTQTEKMISQGASFIDIGAYSSRPNAKHIEEEEELNRIVPVVSQIIKEFPEIIISIDTFRNKIARETIHAGAAMINDISGGSMDKKMFETIAELQVPYILMHMQGTPQNMQKNPNYTNVTQEVIDFLSKKIFTLRTLKVNDIIIDVGFGFGKTLKHNFELLKNLLLFKQLDVPNLVGLSRKSMLYKTINCTPKEALNATTSANTIALLNGANILRVHDVKQAIEAIKITRQVTTI